MKEISETILNCQFAIEEVKAMTIKSKSGKSPRTDRIIAELLKDPNDDTLNTILNIFNKILNVGEFPEEWAVGIIIILFKVEESNDLNNYRGITLLSILGKLLVGMLNERLAKFAETIN